MCLVRVRPHYDDEGDVYIRRVRRPSRSETRVSYSPRASARETRSRGSHTYITEAPRTQYVIEERPRVQYLVKPPHHGVQIHQAAPVSRDIPKSSPPPPPPAAPMPPPAPPVAKPKPPPPPPAPAIVKEKEKEPEKVPMIEKKREKTPSPKPPAAAEQKSRLEIVSVEHSMPPPPPNVRRKHSAKTSESPRGGDSEYDNVIVERQRSGRYVIDPPARRSVPDYDTYRYIEAPPTPRKEVRYILEDIPRRSEGAIHRERERVVIDSGGRMMRKREYFR